MPTISTADKLACVERELRYRERVYARLAMEGRMTQKKQDHELACMRAIVADYTEALEKERLL